MVKADVHVRIPVADFDVTTTVAVRVKRKQLEGLADEDQAAVIHTAALNKLAKRIIFSITKVDYGS